MPPKPFGMRLCNILDLGPNAEVECFIDAGGGIQFYPQARRSVQRGLDMAVNPGPPTRPALRPSIRTLLPTVRCRILQTISSVFPVPPRRFQAGDAVDLRGQGSVGKAKEYSIVVELEGGRLAAWAQTQLRATKLKQ
ncbi:hypothetical protein B0H17DRAFT_1142787 [Mycena rosella]|uniref:Uncharacterized protein n=1 Tax=Mycena rosella TaxID=1033263 RepID=A0AAD7CWY6_MYCRO|nr:hypothetical protein B0H17DRAFT_1142787 [Mycena rosella]